MPGVSALKRNIFEDLPELPKSCLLHYYFSATFIPPVLNYSDINCVDISGSLSFCFFEIFLGFLSSISSIISILESLFLNLFNINTYHYTLSVSSKSAFQESQSGWFKLLTQKV